MLRLSWETLTVSFVGAAVEWVEAFTVVLAVSLTAGWRRAGVAAGLGLLLVSALMVLTHTAMTLVMRLPYLQFGVGVFLLLFGLRWFGKAVARMAGLRALHDEGRVFTQTQAAAARAEGQAAVLMAFNAVVIEGLEVWLIVAALGSASGHARSASLGALLALLVVMTAGLALRAPLTRVPENAMKYAVACALLTFGTFWTAEALSPAAWPLGELSPILVFIAYFAGGRAVAQWLRRRPAPAARP